MIRKNLLIQKGGDSRRKSLEITPLPSDGGRGVSKSPRSWIERAFGGSEAK